VATGNDATSSPVASPERANDVPFHTHVVGCSPRDRAGGRCAFWPPSRHDLRLSFASPEKRHRWQCVVAPHRAYFWRTTPGATANRIDEACARIERMQRDVAARRANADVADFDRWFADALRASRCFRLRTQRMLEH